MSSRQYIIALFAALIVGSAIYTVRTMTGQAYRARAEVRAHLTKLGACAGPLHFETIRNFLPDGGSVNMAWAENVDCAEPGATPRAAGTSLFPASGVHADIWPANDVKYEPRGCAFEVGRNSRCYATQTETTLQVSCFP
jgi:hypothetical protein